MEIDNPPAFPTQDDYVYYHGMTLRDWFAGQALAGLAAEGRTLDRSLPVKAYAIADAMLAARKEPRDD